MTRILMILGRLPKLWIETEYNQRQKCFSSSIHWPKSEANYFSTISLENKKKTIFSKNINIFQYVDWKPIWIIFMRTYEINSQSSLVQTITFLQAIGSFSSSYIQARFRHIFVYLICIDWLVSKFQNRF